MTATEHPGAQSARDAVLATSGRFWSASDLPGAQSTRHHLLTALTHDGELLHVRRGLYWRGRKTRLGMSPPAPEVLVEKLVGTHGVGPAGLSASHRLRLSTQIPRREEIAVPERAPSSTAQILFVSRAGRPLRKATRLTADEVAVLEALDGWSQIIEVPLIEAWQRLRASVERGDVSAVRLAEAAGTEPALVRVRLSALLTQAGYDDAAHRVPVADPRLARRALPAQLAAAGA